MPTSTRMLAKVTKTVPRFLAYCSILKACRRMPQVRRGLPVAVALILPQGADAEAYEKAAYATLHGERMFDRLYRHENAAVFSCWQGSGKAARNFTAEEALTFERVIVLAKAQSDFPAGFAAVADAVIEVPHPEPRHVIAAVELCLGQRCSVAEAQAILATPHSLLGCGSAWNKDPVSGVIGIQKGPL